MGNKQGDDGNYGDHSACDLKLPTGRQYKFLGISDHPWPRWEEDDDGDDYIDDGDYGDHIACDLKLPTGF